MKKSFPVIFIGILTLIILATRLQVLFTRFIDPDEFAHLHWAYLISIGKLPYRDFFFFITPLYQWFLRPVFFLPEGPSLVIIARIWQYLIYLASLCLLYAIGIKITRNQTVGLLSVFLLSVFPMTYDKTIDIRPDMLMIFFLLLGIYLILKNASAKKSLILSGVCFATGLLILPKIIFALPALAFLIIVQKQKSVFLSFVAIFIGALVPVFLLIIYLLYNNIFPIALHSIFVDSFAANTGRASFSLLLALSPWPIVYIDRAGVSLPWVINLLLFVMIIPGLIFLWFINKKFTVFLFLFLLSGLIFLMLFPVPYLQYFLPFTPFISLLAALTINNLILIFEKLNLGKILLFLFGLVLVFSYYQQYRGRAVPSNKEQLRVISDILSHTKPNEAVYDMVGSYVFRPDSYYICCHPYAEFASRLTMGVPTLSEALVSSETKFLVQDRTGLLFWKPAPQDLAFLASNYLPAKYRKIYSHGHQYSCQNKSCTKLDYDAKPLLGASVSQFQIIATDNYQVNISPAEAMVLIDEKVVNNGSVFLSRGKHTLNFPSNITSLKIQLER